MDFSNRAFRMLVMAIMNGLREGGDLSPRSIEAIAANIRKAATSGDGVVYKGNDAPFLLEMARAIEAGDDGMRDPS